MVEVGPSGEIGELRELDIRVIWYVTYLSVGGRTDTEGKEALGSNELSGAFCVYGLMFFTES